MKKALIVFMLAVAGGGVGPAQSPPPPSVVANTVSNLWHTRSLAELSVYATNLYSSATNYVPAILVSVFHDSVFTGDLQPAISNLVRIQHHAAHTPQGYTDTFKRSLAELLKDSREESEMHAAWGNTPQVLQTNASPQTVRDAWDGLPLPFISILFEAPSVTLP